MVNYSSKASFFRTALLLGLLPGSIVLRWAEEVIESSENIPHPFYEIAMISPEDITALRYALLNLCTENISPEVLKAIFGLVFRDHYSNKRSFEDTMTVLNQIRRFIKIDHTTFETLISFEIEFSDAVNSNNITGIRQKVHSWLFQHRSEECAFV